MVKHACISLQCSVLQLLRSVLRILGLMLCVIAIYSVLVVCVGHAVMDATWCLLAPPLTPPLAMTVAWTNYYLLLVTSLDAYDQEYIYKR